LTTSLLGKPAGTTFDAGQHRASVLEFREEMFSCPQMEALALSRRWCRQSKPWEPIPASAVGLCGF